MKKLLLATTAVVVMAATSAGAADLRPAYRPAPPPPVYTWTGLFWGVNVGYSWGEAKRDVTLQIAPGVFGTASRSREVDGVIGGIQTGYNHQFGNWVFGFETDFQASGQKGSEVFQLAAGPPATFLNTEDKLTWFGTSRTRLGVLWSPTVLLYGTAGIAYGTVKEDSTITSGNLSATATFRDVKAGWTAGAGIEGALGGGWSTKVEYLYMDLGKTEQTVATPGLGTLVTLNHRFTDNIVRIGFNYKWGGGYGGGMGGLLSAEGKPRRV